MNPRDAANGVQPVNVSSCEPVLPKPCRLSSSGTSVPVSPAGTLTR